ncbi:hypothetical protein BVX98_00905 [bacterium F11]|nr:hypothetical protein BVX98_00905 [bacterium F11]
MNKTTSSKEKSKGKNTKKVAYEKWSSPIPESRWRGFRSKHKGVEAFKSLEKFEQAQLSELEHSLEDHEKKALSPLLAQGKKDAIEIFIRTHGANPISDPGGSINIPVGVAKADVIDLAQEPSAEANAALLRGEVVYVLFQAGEGSRFNRGPMFSLNPLEVAKELSHELDLQNEIDEIERKKKEIDPAIASFLSDGPLGPKQPILIRAGLRRVVQDEVRAGRLDLAQADQTYQKALQNQKILFFMGRRGGLSEEHHKALSETYGFYGFHPQNLVTVDQELVHGLTLKEDGSVQLLTDEMSSDAAGHLYAFLQAARQGDFTMYTESGRPIKSMELDALGYLATRGGNILSIIRINDMDRHSTEIVNAKALGYTLSMFKKGYFNVIEGVANPKGQKGGTGTTFIDPETHVLTETHENSYPILSRAIEKAMKEYLKKNQGRHPAYNAMRQWASLQQTRKVLRDFGGRIVFVPRQKKVDGKQLTYLGVDMPMGDLSLFLGHYSSRMFQFSDPEGKELLIHDMKRREDLDIALRTILKQMEDPNIIAATREVLKKEKVPIEEPKEPREFYGAPVPEFE